MYIYTQHIFKVLFISMNFPNIKEKRKKLYSVRLVCSLFLMPCQLLQGENIQVIIIQKICIKQMMLFVCFIYKLKIFKTEILWPNKTSGSVFLKEYIIQK